MNHRWIAWRKERKGKMSFLNLEGKTALVTGGAQGIGEAVVRSLCEAGAVVAVIDRNPQKLNDFVARLKSAGCKAEAFPADVSDREAVDTVIEGIERNLGPIEILVNVAGVLHMGWIAELSDEAWEKTFTVNTTGVFYISRAVSRYMVSRGHGSIVTVGSNAAKVPRIAMAAYASSKAAAAMFTKCLGLELARHNIRCNIVSPGSTNTPMQWSLWNDADGAAAVIDGSQEAFKTGIPLKKLADPSDIAAAVLFLVSDKAGHITMHDICVDGGATLGV
ncbi:2,3-dihydro-2,3-dihydroxybenzoate dehydrogenase [Propionispora sp. 2/2-37]|uniref:2,3-dihydro-2,3-dihydroxybenzoate dehydrogenase n=1 Tax=Propionispora sp. 2/2-37 TaxID=1677858 RepID=UPI0006C075C6|nr:2,3-dihydro-2,3-dihydroxybenzoate dehydrogenase [Propionispora sp. 2/2-37]CUH95311.1 2,3-dihydro-2,3-dihydroxybenzoate dehydrogenase [Propionispora sp. 2/2-37]